MEDPELSAVIVSFFAGGLLHFLMRSWLVSIVVPLLGTFFVLGYIDSNRPYIGGGASFYIFIQVIFTMSAAGVAVAAVLVIEKFFPESKHNDH